MSGVKESKPRNYLPLRLNQDISPSLYGVAHRLLEVHISVAEEPFHKDVAGLGLQQWKRVKGKYKLLYPDRLFCCLLGFHL